MVGEERVIIDCRTEHDSYFMDPDDCSMFYHCSDWTGLEHKSCGALYFHPQKRVCDWPHIVRRVRFDCPAEDPVDPAAAAGDIVVYDEDEFPAAAGGDAEELPAFDDGSVFKFEPEPQNKFRDVQAGFPDGCTCCSIFVEGS